MNKTTGLKLCALIVLAGFGHGCKQTPSITQNTLAVVGKRLISKDDFKRRYLDFRRRTGEGVPDTYAARKSVLQAMIAEEVLLIEARNRNLDTDGPARKERARIEMQQLLTAFNRKFVADNVTITDAELRELFVRFKTRIKARHLYAATREEADRLYQSVLRGASFDELAKKVFKDPKLRESGGSLGYFTVDEMEPAFEDAAFSLAVGEVSPPVRTTDGYSIIRVDDRVANPMVTEFEFATQKDKLHSYLHRRKVQLAVQDFSHKVGAEMEITFDKGTVNRLFAWFESEGQQLGSWNEQAPASLATLADSPLLNCKRGSWTVADFWAKAQFTSEKQKGWIRTPEDLRDFISGLVIRQEVLARARDAGLHETERYRSAVREEWETYLLGRIEQALKDEMVVPEDSLRRYFDDDPTLFALPAEINLREIVLRDEPTALLVEKKLKAGKSFAALAKAHSVRRWSAERGGELGFLTPQDFGKWAPKVFSLDVGELAGPVKMDSMIVFLKCIGKKPARTRTFQEAREDVEKTMRYLMWEDYRSAAIKRIKKAVTTLAAFPEKLKTVRLN